MFLSIFHMHENDATAFDDCPFTGNIFYFLAFPGFILTGIVITFFIFMLACYIVKSLEWVFTGKWD